MSSRIKWACPQCGAPANRHGKGGASNCMGRSRECAGMICECAVDTGKDHGTAADPCPEATCYHCRWSGTFPPPVFDERRLKGWAKTAWSAGWRPPIGWTP